MKYRFVKRMDPIVGDATWATEFLDPVGFWDHVSGSVALTEAEGRVKFAAIIERGHKLTTTVLEEVG
jgi:hypothetical protein